MARSSERLRADLVRLHLRMERLKMRQQLLDEKLVAAIDREAQAKQARRLKRARETPSV
jgi:hypothetical protein